jgi:enoyl-CoA hydratase/carnithine racemase
MSDRELVRVERDGDVALVVLQRPEARNAMNKAMAAATCDAIAAGQDAACMVLTGEDPAFCAGLDLRDLGVGTLAELPGFIAAAASSQVPIIAAVNGPAVTGGFELALACDFIVASERAAFADTHLRVGVYPGPVLVDLPRRVGEAWAREMSLTGDFVDAATALRIGIANHVVAHEDLVPFALRKASAIAEQPRAMVATMRQDWEATVGTPRREARRIHAEHAVAASAATTPTGASIASHREAVIARAKASRGER